MEGIKRFYNQNRRTIWMVVGITVSFLVILQLLNHWSKNSNKKEEPVSSNTSANRNNTYDNIELETKESVVSGDKLSKSQIKTQVSLIEEFVSYCNNKEIDKAYELLTNDCKEEMFHEVGDFEEIYYNRVFNGEKKEASVENWINNTYKVKYQEDMLSTGKYIEETKQDNITVVKQDSENKLNINGYIGRTTLNKKKSQDGITIKVKKKDTYMNFEKYEIEISNNTNSDIILDSKEDENTMYLEDSNEVHYTAYSHEITDNNLNIFKNDIKTIEIKYYSKYISSKEIKKLVFSDIITNLNGYNDVKKIEVNI